MMDTEKPAQRDDERDAPQAETEQASGMAQVGNRKVPRPSKVGDRSVPDDIDE